VLNGFSAIHMADIIRQANAQKSVKQDWENKLQDMQNAHQQVKALDADRVVEAELKMSAWRRCLLMG